MKKLVLVTAIALFLTGCLNTVDLPNSNASLNAYSQGCYTLNEQDKRDLSQIMGFSTICRDIGSKLAPEFISLLDEGTRLVKQLNPKDSSDVLGAVAMGVCDPYLIKKGMPETYDSVLFLVNKNALEINKDVAMIAQKKYGVTCGHSTLSSAINRFKQIATNLH